MCKDIVFNTGESQFELRQKYNPEGSLLRRAQMIMLDMLIYIDQVCKKQGIQYFLFGGNVLGAIRHGGFIPWDDDVDIALDMKNYKRLCDYLKSHPHPRYVLQDHDTDYGYCSFWSVLRDTKSEYFVDSNVHRARKFRGLQVDIFPISAGNIRFLYRVAFKISYLNAKYFVGQHSKIASLIYKIQNDFVHPLFQFISLLGGDKSIYMHSYGQGFPNKMVVSDIFPVSVIEFEGHQFSGPAKPERYLQAWYGNYKELPPIDKRNHHQATYAIYED